MCCIYDIIMYYERRVSYDIHNAHNIYRFIYKYMGPATHLPYGTATRVKTRVVKAFLPPPSNNNGIINNNYYHCGVLYGERAHQLFYNMLLDFPFPFIGQTDHNIRAVVHNIEYRRGDAITILCI